jgi:hypothetical protein
MQKQALLEHVRAAAEAFRLATARHSQHLHKQVALTTDAGYAAAKAPLVAQLASEKELEVFNGLMIVFRNSSRRASYEDLADWLAERAATVGEENAVDRLEQYLRDAKFEYKVFAAIAGVEVEEETRFASDVVLSGSEALPQYVLEHNPLSVSDWHRRPTAALTQTRFQTRMHVPSGDEEFLKGAAIQAANEPIDDALMCITVVGSYAPVIVGLWYDAPDAPVRSGFGELPRSLEIGWPAKLPKADASAAADLYTVFASLGRKQRERLRVPMRRLNAARRRRDPVDSAIDLGIALEAVFGDTQPAEHTFKVRVRAARYLGDSSADRERIYELAGTLYDLRSLAVHTGTLISKRTKGLDIGKTLTEGHQLVADVIKKLIHGPDVDWRSTVLS